jgi:hypothetical protein
MEQHNDFKTHPSESFCQDFNIDVNIIATSDNLTDGASRLSLTPNEKEMQLMNFHGETQKHHSVPRKQVEPANLQSVPFCSCLVLGFPDMQWNYAHYFHIMFS